MVKLDIIFISRKENKKFEQFVSSLQTQTQAKIIRTIDLLEKHGLFLPMPHAKKIMTNLWELRTLGKQQVRIIYSVINNKIILLDWFIKKGNKIPAKVIKKSSSSLQKYIKNGIFRK